MDNEEKPLIIPNNCPPVKYVIGGFTGTDLAYVGIVGTAALLIAVFLYMNSNNSIKAVGFFVFCVAAAAMILHRDLYTENFIDKIRILLEYQKSQKCFLYFYVDEYQCRMEAQKKNESENRGNAGSKRLC